MQEAGHRGIAATLPRLREHFLWSTMEADLRKLITKCLYYTNRRAPELLPRPHANPLHGKHVGDVVHLYLLYLRES